MTKPIPEAFKEYCTALLHHDDVSDQDDVDRMIKAMRELGFAREHLNEAIRRAKKHNKPVRR